MGHTQGRVGNNPRQRQPKAGHSARKHEPPSDTQIPQHVFEFLDRGGKLRNRWGCYRARRRVPAQTRQTSQGVRPRRTPTHPLLGPTHAHDPCWLMREVSGAGTLAARCVKQKRRYLAHPERSKASSKNRGKQNGTTRKPRPRDGEQRGAFEKKADLPRPCATKGR